MSENPSREVHSGDRWSEEAKSKEQYWLCECGVAREKCDSIINHLDETNHFAERINVNTGEVTAFLAGGLEYGKYGTQVPDSAHIQREALKNEPMFPR